MFDVLSTSVEVLRRLGPSEIARIAAHLLAPGLVLGLAISGVYTTGLAIDLGRPVAIAELKSEITANGDVASKPGIALIVEPVAGEYRIPFGSNPGKIWIWSSLDPDAARANADRLVLSEGGLRGRAPFVGVTEPVTIVVEGDLGKELHVPGGRSSIDDWRLPSRRSISIVSSALLACVFAFGMSLVTGLPSVGGGKKDTAG